MQSMLPPNSSMRSRVLYIGLDCNRSIGVWPLSLSSSGICESDILNLTTRQRCEAAMRVDKSCLAVVVYKMMSKSKGKFPEQDKISSRTGTELLRSTYMVDQSNGENSTTLLQ